MKLVMIAAGSTVFTPGLIAGFTASPVLCAGILAARAWQQELTVDTALSGDRALALQALLADPLVPSVEAATAMLDAALDAHAPFLPRFQGGTQHAS